MLVNAYFFNRTSVSRRALHVEKKKSAFLTIKIKACDAIALKAIQENHVVSRIQSQSVV